jgi:ribose transport system substrate-binding protein
METGFLKSGVEEESQMATTKWIASSLRSALGLSGGVALLALQAQASLAYTYNSDSPDATKVFGADFAKSLGLVTAKPGIRIGVILKSLSNQYWQGIESGVKAGAKAYGVDVSVQAANSESDHTQQLTIAQTMIGKKFDAYIVSPEASSNLTPAIKQMQEAGVPIVNTDDARIAGSVYVGPSHELDGSQAADFIAQHLPDGGDVAQIEGQAGSNAAILRIKGFKDGLAKHPNLKLVASVPGNWDGTLAYNDTQTLLRKNPNIKAFYADNDTMAVGVAKAVSDMGLSGKVIIVGTDGIPAVLDGIKKGTISATVTPLPFYQGYWSVEAAVRLLAGQKVPDWVVAPAQLITKDNIDQYFDSDNNVKPGLYN